jgi:hypothetical protein
MSGSVSAATMNGIVSERPLIVLPCGSITRVGRESSAGLMTSPLIRTSALVAS